MSLLFYCLLCGRSHAPSSDVTRKDVIVGNVDTCAAGRYDIEVLVCAGSRSWKDGGAHEVSV